MVRGDTPARSTLVRVTSVVKLPLKREASHSWRNESSSPVQPKPLEVLSHVWRICREPSGATTAEPHTGSPSHGYMRSLASPPFPSRTTPLLSTLESSTGKAAWSNRSRSHSLLHGHNSPSESEMRAPRQKRLRTGRCQSSNLTLAMWTGSSSLCGRDGGDKWAIPIFVPTDQGNSKLCLMRMKRVPPGIG